MKFSRFLVILLLGTSLLTACKNQGNINVRHVRNLETGHTLQGYYYALPRTVITVEVAAIKTTETPGPFAQFASRLLGLENVIMQPSVSWELGDVKIRSYAEPDPSEFYFAEFNAQKNQKNPLALYLSQTGLIMSVNTPPADDPSFSGHISPSRQQAFGSEATFNHFIETNLQERIDTIIERVRMDTTTVERRTLRRTWVEKSSEVRAREVADYILKLRNKKFDLISGFAEIPYSRDAMKYMYEQMDRQENDYLELFTGIRTQSMVRYRFTYLPDKNKTSEPEILFYFSRNEGVVKENRRGAEPVYLQVTSENATRQPAVFLMNPTRSNAVERGFFYRIPEYANLKIFKENKPVADARLLISQFGIITSLPPDDLRIEFYPETGAIRSIERIRQ